MIYCCSLNNLFNNQPTDLQKELLEWLPESLHEQCTKKWSKIIENKYS